MESQIDKNSVNDEIDVKKILNLLIRNKFLIGGISLIGTIFGISYSLLKQPIYSGYFQIIVENERLKGKVRSEASSLGPISNLISTSSNSFNKTQEAILRSPSVLKPVFEYVKENYSDKEPSLSRISYQAWSNKFLKIKFEEGTNVLNINYQGKNKDAIISTLNEISSRYQSYSKRDRQRSIKKGIEYLKSQEKIYKSKSAASLKKFNKFSIKNGLGNIDGFVGLQDQDKRNKFNLERYLSDNNAENTIQPLNSNSSGAGQRYNLQFELLSKYESQLTDLKSQLKPNSEILKDLERRIENLRESLKRPNEILIEYRVLKRNASRDENVLNDIENNLIVLKLEEVRQQTPWELISKPTIKDIRVSPKRKQISITSLILSFISGAIIAFIKEKREELVFEIEDYTNLIPYTFIDKCFQNKKELNHLILKKFFFNGRDCNEEISLINLDDSFFESKQISVSNYLSKKNIFKIINSENISELRLSSNTLLVVNPGQIKISNLNLIIQYLGTFNLEKIGWIFLKEDSKKFDK